LGHSRLRRQSEEQDPHHVAGDTADETELAKLPENRVPERADWARLSSAWSKRIDERIAELERL
jgi:hypothetical protein